MLDSFQNTVRPRGTRPRSTWTSLVHDFKKGSKIFEISDFGTWTSQYTILKTAQNHYVLIESLPHELRQCIHSTHVLTQTDHHIFHIWMVSFLHELMQYANSNHISNQATTLQIVFQQSFFSFLIRNIIFIFKKVQFHL